MSTNIPFFQGTLQGEAETRTLGRRIAALLNPGDLVFLSGDLGVGKTTLAQGLIQALIGEEAITSPSFPLAHTWETPHGPLWHFDLYRLKDPEEMWELGWEESRTGIAVVEWPERLGLHAETPTFHVVLNHQGANRRAIVHHSQASSWAGATQHPLPQDCSPRRYTRLQHPDGRSALLMASPPDQKMQEFCLIDTELRHLGLSAPEIYAVDLEAGSALLEDFGERTYTRHLQESPGDEEKLYQLALEALIHLQEHSHDHLDLPAYDWPLLEKELRVCLDYYLPFAQVEVCASAQDQFLGLWKTVFETLPPLPPTLVLRDYHVDNLFYLPERESGYPQVGLIDFQDGVIGSPLYDVVSLFEDARRDVPLQFKNWVETIYAPHFPHWPLDNIWAHYHAYGAQRSIKILGVFARQATLYQNPKYLVHLPRVVRWVNADFAHPILAEIRAWWQAHIPPLPDSTNS